MVCTLDYLRERFAVFNAQCFAGRLSAPRLRVGKSRRMLGSVRYRRVATARGKSKVENISLTISAAYDLPPQEIDDTILHEMIHLYILSLPQRDTSTHGTLFRSMMRDFNQRYGCHITISRRGMLPLSPQPPQKMIVVITTLRDGTTCVTRPALTRLWEVQRTLARLPMVRRQQWYRTANQYFTTFPRSIKLKFYRTDKEQLRCALEDAIPLNITFKRPKQ